MKTSHRLTLAVTFISLSFGFCIAGSAQITPPSKPLNKKKRLEILVDNIVKPRIEDNDTVLLYLPDGYTTQLLQPGRGGGFLVPVYWDPHDGLSLFLQKGDVVSWMHPDINGQPQDYSSFIQFDSSVFNPCKDAVGASPNGPCEINITKGPVNYSCKYCGDPKIVVRPSTGGLNLAVELTTRNQVAQANELAALVDAQLSASLKDKKLAEKVKEQIEAAAAKELAAAKEYATIAQEAVTKTYLPPDASQTSRQFTSKLTRDALEVPLVCRNDTASISVGAWHGAPATKAINWYASNVDGDWTVTQAVINPTTDNDNACKGTTFQADAQNYAGTCTSTEVPVTITFNVTQMNGSACNGAWACTSSAEGGSCRVYQAK